MRLAVLLSGRGSNFTAIHNAIQNGELNAEIVCVITNRPDAAGIQCARKWGYDSHVIDHREYASREAHEAEVLRVLEHARPDYIALAGYMRLLTPSFVERYRNRILNIHPSLLPKYPGLHPQQQALDDHASESGATVHFVNKDLDAGPIVLQQSIPVRPGDTAETLAARILEVEHQLYPRAIERVLGGH